MPQAATQAIDQWLHRRSRLRWRFWFYLLVAGVGAVFFIRNFRGPDPYLFAMLLLIPLIALRQAWKTDRLITICDWHCKAATIELGKKSPTDKQPV